MNPDPCQNCGRRTGEVSGQCRRCVSLAPFAAYRAWLALLNADQRAGRGVLVKAGSDG